MTRGRRTIALLALVAALAASETVALDPRTPFVGRTLVEAIERLESTGLTILYSSDLVRPEMRVLAEPTGSWPREILAEILAPHGLEAETGPAGTVLIVAARTPGSIRGIVVLAGSGRPLGGVRVSTADGAISAVTDRRGRFTIGPLPDGRYRLELERSGFVRQRVEGIDVRSGAASQVRFELDGRPPLTEQVVVHGEDEGSVGRGPEPRQALGPDELRSAPDLGTDPLRAVERLAGVGETDGRGALHVRGGAADEVAIIVDGLEIYAPFHLRDRGGPVSTIDSRNIAAVELLGGAFPAEYGGRMSGVIEMDTVLPTDLQADLSYTTNDARLAGQGRFGDGRGQWLVSARRGDPSALLDALQADPGYAPRYADAFAKMRFRLGERTTISADLLESYDEVEGGDRTMIDTVYDPGTFRSLYRSAYAWVTVENVWSPRWVTRTRVSLGRFSAARDGSSARVALVEDDRSAALVALDHRAWREAGPHLLKWGAALERAEGSYRYVAVPAVDGGAARDVELDPKGNALEAYIADQVRVTSALRVELGLRWDARSYVPGGGSLEPRLNLGYDLGRRTTLRAGWGRYGQAPRIHELGVQDGVETFFPVQSAEHRLVGIEHVLGGGERLGVLLYQKLVDDPAPRFENVFDAGGFFPESDPDRQRIDPTRGRSEGVELTAQGQAHDHLAWRASYALSRAEDAIDGAWVPRAWDQRHAIDFTLAWRSARRWDASLAGVYHSGHPTTPIAGATSATDPIVGAHNSARLPDYLRFDARVGRRFELRGTTLSTFVQVTNLLDRENTCCLERVAPTTVEPVFRSGLPRLVTLGVSWTF